MTSIIPASRRQVAHVAASLGLALAGACREIDAPNFNNPSVGAALEAPTRGAIANAAQGLLRGTRVNVGESVRWLGAFGREGYPMAATGASLPGSVRDPLVFDGFPGNVLYADPYRNILGANLLLAMVDAGGGLTETEKAAVRGFARTIVAYDLLQVIVTRDRFGAPVDVGTDPNAQPAPILPRDEVYARIARLLDQAATDLRAGGTAFPFTPTSGLTGFSTPATFLRLNRALKARVSVYRDQWADALAALGESFLDTTQPLAFGAYHVYSTTSGDIPNPNFRPDLLWAHRRLRTEAQRRPDGGLDLRAQNKLVSVPVFTLIGISSDLQFSIYNSPTAPIPWVKNEELILLRAEANLGLGNRAAAIRDINVVRTNSGGLAPLPESFSGDLLGELLYNKRYSLMWEGGHTWIDMRHYGRLAQIPVGRSDPRLFDAMPIPGGECQVRSPQPPGCEVVTGITPPPTGP